MLTPRMANTLRRDMTASRGRRASVVLLRAAAVAGLGASLDTEDAVPAGGSVADLLERAFHNLYAEDYIQTMTLSTRARGGAAMTRELQIARKQSAQPGKALVRFLAPYQIRRTSILILENDGRADDLYVFLPAIGRTRHLSGSQRADSFFGTDLAYEDVEPKQASDYVARRMGTDTVGESTCALLEIEAKPHFKSSYERMISCVEPERALIDSTVIPATKPERLALTSWLHGGPVPSQEASNFLDVGCGDGANLIALAYYNRALVLIDMKHPEDAIRDLTAAIGLDKDYAGAYAQRGLLYEKSGAREQAIADFRAALAAPAKFDSGQWAHRTARARLIALGIEVK